LIFRRLIIAAALPICSIGASVATASGQNHGHWTLDAVLEHLNASGKEFHSLIADVERTKVTVVVNDRSTEAGTILVRGDKMLLNLRMPDPRTILRNGDTLYVYTPGLRRVEEYNLGKNRDWVDQLLLLGFGTTGKQLHNAYAIALGGETKLGDNTTIELELIPKSESFGKQISKIQIWLDTSTWLPVQQEFYEAGSGDYSIVRYSKMELNAPVPDSAFKPHWPKGTEKLKPPM
jgi:outer membrane lipoprotein-sorting protein